MKYMVCWAAITALAIVAVLSLSGCGADPSEPTPSPTASTTTTTTKRPWECTTNLYLDVNVANMSKKGMALDDTTMSECPDRIAGIWPNTKDSHTKNIRLFAAWKSEWNESKRNASWSNLVTFVHENNVKVLMGVDSTADVQENEKQWAWALQLMGLIGKDYILGMSFGNEMLVKFLPDSFFVQWFAWIIAKVHEMDAAGYEDLPLTIVWSGAATPRIQLKNLPALETIYNNYSARWVWSYNPYPLWSLGLWPTSKEDCHAKTQAALGLGLMKSFVTAFRKAVSSFTGKNNDTIWVGETGWSSPCSNSQHNIQVVCPEWCSDASIQTYYKNFLEWDGSINEGLPGVDMMFYFTDRDAKDFGDFQPFGLIKQCNSTACKLQKPSTDKTILF